MNAAGNVALQLEKDGPNDVEATDGLPEILYVMGTGRSGTTILEILLANEPGVTGAGEMRHIFRDGFLRNRSCGCGLPSRQCAMWSSVLQSTGWGPDDWNRIRLAQDQLEHHARFPLTYFGVGGKRSAALYQQANEALIRSIRSTTRCKVVVDSSKYPARALLLARQFPERVKVLCITRSAAGLIAAFGKNNADEQHPKKPLAAAAYYMYVLWCMRLVRSRLKERSFAIRFEDMNRDPAAVLSSIEAWSGYSFATSRAKLDSGDFFDVGHIVTGNRLRKQGRVKFDPRAPNARSQEKGAIRMGARILEFWRRLMGF